jgi:hypothetical protein
LASLYSVARNAISIIAKFDGLARNQGFLMKVWIDTMTKQETSPDVAPYSLDKRNIFARFL